MSAYGMNGQGEYIHLIREGGKLILSSCINQVIIFCQVKKKRARKLALFLNI